MSKFQDRLNNIFRIDERDKRPFNHWTWTGIWFNYIGSLIFFIVSIVCLIFVPFSGSVLTLSLMLMFGSIACIGFNSAYQTTRNRKYKWVSGLLGSFFGFFVGGICILLNDSK